MNKLESQSQQNGQLLKFEPDSVVSPLVNSEHATLISLSLVSPETALMWSSGEILNAGTFDNKTGKPVVGGLFCPRVFGPFNASECLCGKPPAKDATECEECGIEFNVS